MSVQSLSVSFSVEAVDLLRLEQEPWEKTLNTLSALTAYRVIYNMLYGGLETTLSGKCGLESDGTCIKIIYAYPAYPGLAYQVKTSYGELSEGVVEEFVHHEAITVTLDDSVNTKYPALRIESVEWTGDVYNEDGVIIQPPYVSLRDGSIHLSEKAYGTLKVSYLVHRKKFELVVKPREGEEEELFSAVVYGLYGGGIVWLETDSPPGADELATGEEECQWSFHSEVIYNDDPFEPPTDDGVSIHRYVDYCSQELIKEEKL